MNNVVSSHDIAVPAPRTIAVQTDVALAYPPRHETRAAQSASAGQVENILNSSLKATLLAHHLMVVDPAENPDLLIRCRIVDVRSGKRALRLFVGYGAGKAELAVMSSLELSRSPEGKPLLSFQTKSTTGGMPGSVVGAAIHSFSKDGLDVEAAETVQQINNELGKYFASQGWPYRLPSSSAGSANAKTL